ncbi:MAG: branched-chain amino acid ABC transporter permease [Actinobacteria bacterium]|nr:branched-chain amino acid ABC transporter permease [Actinomycetota bacterium]
MGPHIFVQVIINGLVIGGIYALVSIGLTLLFGVTDIINFAHGEYLMLGMYITYFTWVVVGLDPFATMLVSAVGMFLVGALIQRYLFKHIMNAPTLAQIFLTVGLQMVLQNTALMVFGPNLRRVEPSYAEHVVKLGAITVSTPKVIAFAVAMGLSAALFVFLSKTDLGKAMKAAQQDRQVAMLMGINTDRIFMIAAGIAAALTGAAGAAISTYYPIQPTAGAIFGLMAYITVILGSLGNLKGAFVGGLILGLAESVGIQFISADAGRLLSFVIFIAVLLIRPEGLFVGREIRR